MVAQEEVPPQRENAVGVHLVSAEVHQEDAEVVVYGTLSTNGGVARRYSGHVHVELMDGDGTEITNACSNTIYLLQRGPGRGA